MAICSKCLDKATEKNGSVAQEEINSKYGRGSEGGDVIRARV